MPKYITLEWDEYQEFVNSTPLSSSQPKESIIHGYGDWTITRALLRKLSPDNSPVTLTEQDFPLTEGPEEIVRVNNIDGSISVCVKQV